MIINFFIGLLIAILPLYLKITDFESNRASKDIIFLLFCVLLFFIMKNVRNILSKEVCIPIIYSVFMLFINQYSQSPMVYFHTFSSIIVLLFSIKYMNSFSAKGIQYIFDGMIVGSIIQSIIGIFGYFGIELYPYILALYTDSFQYSVPNIGKNNVLGSLGNTNTLASYLAISFPAFFTRKNTKTLCIIPLVALGLSQSWMGICALFAGIIYFFIIKYSLVSKIKIYLVSIIAMIIIPFFNIGIDSGRFFVWRNLFREVSFKHWIIGMGPGWFADQNFSVSASERFAQEHNSYLTIFNVFGLSIFILLIPLFYRFINKKLDPIIEVFIFIIFCNSWGHFTIQQSTVMIMIIPIMCISIVILYEKDFDNSIHLYQNKI